ncbi:MAG: Hpt domain-containing protein [Pseudomonadota bacterium]
MTLRQEGAMVSQHLAELNMGGGDWQQALTDALELAHKIKGSSGTIGYTMISKVAEALEFHLRDLDEEDAYPEEAARERANSLFSELNALLSDMKPEQSSLFNRTLA